MARKPKDPVITAKPNNNKMNDHVARLRVVQEVSSRNSSASWNSSCTFSTEQSVQDQPRPPVYNVEDYAGSLRKFGKRGPSAADLNGDTSPDPKQTEMTLKEFTSTTELLDKLSADLKLAYFSFVQEFVGDPIDGVTLLLELLKTIQQSGTQTKCTPANQRRVTLDENACLQCLKYCLRCQDAARKLAISPAGLYTLAACIMSTVNQSRLLTLELLTKACCESGTADGHNTVSDAMSTMRLRFAEPVRFRFLVGMMSGNGTSGMELLLAGLKFINAFTETCPDLQTKFYVQAELKQAGFKPAGILKNISNKSPLLSSVSDEIYRWQKNFINVESLKRQHDEVSREAKSLREKVAMLEKKIHVLQDEKRAMVSSRNNNNNNNNKDAHHHSMTTTTMPQKTCNNKIDGTGGGGGRGGGGGGGNSAEDEGISSSEQDDCEDDVPAAAVVQRCKDDAAAAVQPVIVNGSSSSPSYGGRLSSRGGDAATTTGTTVDGVLEDFDKVINDASTESGGGDERRPRRAPVRYYRAAAVATVPEDDAVIVPTRIVPEPPRRSRSLFVNKNFEVNPFFEEEDDDDDDDMMDDEDESADSECAYDEEDDEVDVQQRVQMMKPGGQTFHSVQKQIERFSELALQRRRDEDRVKADLLQHQHQQQQQQQGRRKSIYDVFGDGRPRVGRSASTRIAVDSGIPPVVPRFGGGGNHCGKSVYLPAAAVAPQVVAGRRSDAAAPADDAAAGPKAVAFAAARGLHCNNNAGLYSGYDQDPAAKCGSQTSNPSGHRTSNGGDRQPNIVGLHRVNLSVSAGKLTDFPSGLY